MANEPFSRRAAHVRSGRSAFVAGEIEWPASPYEVREGTLIEAFLITAIHSDLPGAVLAQVSRNVYDSQTQQALLIPKGTRLVGTYDSQVALGQGRLLRGVDADGAPRRALGRSTRPRLEGPPRGKRTHGPGWTATASALSAMR